MKYDGPTVLYEHIFLVSASLSLPRCFNSLSCLLTLKKAPAAVPIGGAWAAGRAESGGAARQWEAPQRRPEQSAVQLPKQRLQCRQPGGQFF